MCKSDFKHRWTPRYKPLNALEKRTILSFPKKEAFKNEYCKICIDEANYFFLFFVRIIVDVREKKLRNEKKPKFYFIKMVYNRVKFLLKESSLIFLPHVSYSKAKEEIKTYVLN